MENRPPYDARLSANPADAMSLFPACHLRKVFFVAALLIASPLMLGPEIAEAACPMSAPAGSQFDGPCNAASLPDGTGRYRLASGMEILTTFRNGISSDVGEWSLGSLIFRGPLRNGLPSGLWQANADGINWQLNLEQGNLHGEIRATLPDGGVLSILLRQGKADGLASIRYPGKLDFRGQFSGSVPDGEWVAQLPEGGTMRVQFEKGVPIGEARIEIGDGQGLSGHFYRGMLHGPGRIWFAGGFDLRGQLEANAPVGRWISPPESMRDLTVTFADRAMNGHGEITLNRTYRVAGPISSGRPTGTWRSPPDAPMPLEVTFTDLELNGYWKIQIQGREFTGVMQRGEPIINFDAIR